MKNSRANQSTQFMEEDLTDRERELAKEFGVQPKTVSLIGKVAARQIGYHVGKMRTEARQPGERESVEDTPIVEAPIDRDSGPGPDETPGEDAVSGDKESRPIRRNLSDQELAEMVRNVGTIWSKVDGQLQSHINYSILASLRGLDYVARQKLLLLMSGLHDEQRDARPESRKSGKSLRELGPLIENIEETVAEENFTERVSNAVFGLSRAEQEELVKELEAAQGADPEETLASEAVTDDDELDAQTDIETERRKVIAGFVARTQKFVDAFQGKRRELATMLHDQTVDRIEQILTGFFEDRQRELLEVPEFLSLPPEAERKLHECLDLIARETEPAETVPAEPVAKKDELDEDEKAELADRTEAIVKQWLLDRDFTTKLAFVLLNGLGLDDHNTGELFDEITGKYEAEIMAAAENPPESLSSKEVFVNGIVAEMLLASARM